MSDRAVIDFSLDAQLRDLAAVIDHLELDRFALLGAGMAAPAAIAFAALHPECVSHLILWSPALNGAAFYPQAETFEKMAVENWDIFTETFAHSLLGWQHGERAREYAAFMRTCVTQEAFVAARPIYRGLDATSYAARVRAATLVLVPRGLGALLLGLARDAAERIGGARLHVLEGDSFAPWISGGDDVLSWAGKFRDEDPPSETPDATKATPLTARETEVLSLLAGGRTAREIAADLGISLSTVQRHIANIYAKIGARGRVDAAAYALARGLVRPRNA